jgi:hypothetical protein
MEHIGVSKPVVGITVPTGYSFNLDGTAIYLTMASLFIATGMGMPMSIPEQIGLLVFMIIASKGAAGVTGAGLATLAGGLQAFRPDLVNGVGVIVGIDRFMSEGRALTNTGNAVALSHRHLDEADRPRPRARCALRPHPSTRPPSPATVTMACRPTPRRSAPGLEEAAIAEAEAKQERARERAGVADPNCRNGAAPPITRRGRGAVVRGHDGVRRRAERDRHDDRGYDRGDGAARDQCRDGRAQQRLVERPRARRRRRQQQVSPHRHPRGARDEIHGEAGERDEAGREHHRRAAAVQRGAPRRSRRHSGTAHPAPSLEAAVRPTR